MIIIEASSGFSKMKNESNLASAHQIIVMDQHTLNAADDFRRGMMSLGGPICVK